MGERAAHTVTDELLAELNYEASDAEEAEYAALVLASVASLSRYGERLVLVAEVDPSLVVAGADPANGEILLTNCPPSAITAWFSDAEGTGVSEAANAARGLSIDEAWEADAVQRLLHTHDLLWNDRVEYQED